MTNRYPGRCEACGGHVAKNAGKLHKQGRRWTVRHLACEAGNGVNTFVIGGREYTRNRGGRCEDAPCCGCCTI